MLQRLLVFLLVIYITAVVFAPPLPGNDLLRIDDFILLLAALISILPRLSSRKTSISEPVLFISVFVYLILLISLFSTLLAGFYSEYDYGGLTKELLRLGKYCLVVFLALSIEDRRYRRFVTYWIVVLGTFVVMTQIAQYIGGSRFNHLFAQFYGGHHHYGVALSPTARARGLFYAGGPFGNPNFASSFLIIPFVLSLFFAFRRFWLGYDNKNPAGKTRFILVIVTFLLLFGIFLTDSRAVMVTVPIVVIFLLLINRSGSGRMATFVGVAVPLTIVLLLAPILTNKGLLFEHVIEGVGTGGSLAVKMVWFKDGVVQLSKNMHWWGFGAGAGPDVDFEAGTFVMWYGIPGAMVYFLLWLGMMWGVIRARRSIENWQAVLAIIMASFIVNFSQNTFLNARIFPIFIVVLLMNITVEARERGHQVAHVNVGQTYTNLASE